MTTYDKLSFKDQQELLKFPVYISLLAANANGTTDDEEKNTAIAFEHTKTYTADPVLGGFYVRSEQLFKQNWQELDQSLPKGKNERDRALKNLLADTNNILQRLGRIYQAVMHKSMQTLKTMFPGHIIIYLKTLFFLSLSKV